jgi:hypothetical protein
MFAKISCGKSEDKFHVVKSEDKFHVVKSEDTFFCQSGLQDEQ